MAALCWIYLSGRAFHSWHVNVMLVTPQCMERFFTLSISEPHIVYSNFSEYITVVINKQNAFILMQVALV